LVVLPLLVYEIVTVTLSLPCPRFSRRRPVAFNLNETFEALPAGKWANRALPITTRLGRVSVLAATASPPAVPIVTV
jgi:hypothetical protein